METTDSYYENYSNYFTSETSVRQIDANGIITTVIHFANQGSYSPSQNGTQTFYTIRDVDVDGSGVVYVLVELDVQVTYGCEDGIESTCNTDYAVYSPILNLDPNSMDYSVDGMFISSNDSFGASSSLFYPNHIEILPSGTILVADNSTIYRLDETNGPISPIATDGTINYSNMTYYNRVPIIGGATSCGTPGFPSCTQPPAMTV